MRNLLHLRPFARVDLHVGPALPPQAATPAALQARVTALRGGRP